MNKRKNSSMEIDLYDEVFDFEEPNQKKQKFDEGKENSKYESIFNKLRAKNALLMAELAKEKELNKTLAKNFHSLLATARRELTKKDKEIKLYKSERNSPFIAKCTKCKHKFDASDCRPPKPTYVRVLKSKLLVEVAFHEYEKLSEWITRIGLARNSDNLPTLPEEVAYELASKSELPTLAKTKSLLAQPGDYHRRRSPSRKR